MAQHQQQLLQSQQQQKPEPPDEGAAQMRNGAFLLSHKLAWPMHGSPQLCFPSALPNSDPGGE